MKYIEKVFSVGFEPFQEAVRIVKKFFTLDDFKANCRFEMKKFLDNGKFKDCRQNLDIYFDIIKKINIFKNDRLWQFLCRC